MSNPKKRGRKSNAELAAMADAARKEGADPVGVINPVAAGYGPVMNGDATHPSPQGVLEEQKDGGKAGITFDASDSRGPPVFAEEKTPAGVIVITATPEMERAQAYAMRVWSGQASDLKRAERIARCERALQGQNLPTEGVLYPTGGEDEDWTEEDMQPVTWRKAGA